MVFLEFNMNGNNENNTILFNHHFDENVVSIVAIHVRHLIFHLYS